MQEGGVIMDVVTPEEAHIAEDAGAVSVMALERVPADIRAQGGVARMSHPDMIKEIIETTSIPVMAKARIGHDDEAKVLQSLGVDMIDESEVLTPADPFYHIAKNDFTIPFVCGCTNLGEAIRRVAEGAAMIRTKGEAGTGNVVAAVTHARLIDQEIRQIQTLNDGGLDDAQRDHGGPRGGLRRGGRRGDGVVPELEPVALLVVVHEHRALARAQLHLLDVDGREQILERDRGELLVRCVAEVVQHHERRRAAGAGRVFLCSRGDGVPS